ncbi:MULTISPECIES: imidazole glycerol phosphate synthase subunit HisH [unclassified Listeria]|uniref:imidazole glycerol phosphate synthase subunit HisH n=1 Tax=unclassified Listeria TaxID=2642072 RepID=UPI000B58C780|nr:MULTISPECIES: imidazole glycerol phosphate synthase subunit HisH [unclassified Listeria]
MIAIIDYDTGNTRSLKKALDFVGLSSQLTADPAEIQTADGIILPGVGAFPDAMAKLEERKLVTPILTAAKKGTPLLGICLGMQLLLDSSEEHTLTKGLGLIPGTVKKIPEEAGFKVPHMGWNQIDVQQENLLTENLNGRYVYFVHSYFAETDSAYISAVAKHSLAVPALIQRENVYGAQFHPEKSDTVGLEILRGFKEVVRCVSTQQLT